ncbi:hypothetical protein [Sphingomonas aerophila]|uniref:Uncharacterized protein n=1 Tax=Sphingomonas aerophila TaxID=1344948 RepID=A0A7W9EW61_9SPHN|nr:hypothetical protein [Sphingomonas aerophila]MBB5717064.1 hypothetical protein [Sphingomonas aerophila]
MPEPDDLIGDVHRSAGTLRGQIAGKDQEIARLTTDLRAARASTDGGDRAATLAAQIEAARRDRRVLDADHAVLVDRLAQRDSCDAPADVPLLLLPVRIETRFDDTGTNLRIRVYPDEIHVDRLDRGLSPEEAAAGQAYWNALWAAGGAAAAQAAQAGAWKLLLEATGASRSHWVARAMTPANMADLGTGAPAFPTPGPRGSGAGLARLLPDRFVAIADQGGTRSRAFGSAIPPEVRIGLLSQDEEAMVEQDGLKILPGTEWLADYDAAASMGLALTLPLARPGKVDRLVVAGVMRSRDPAEAAADLSQLLDAHWSSDGFAFLPQGTPTNNTESARAAWQRRVEKTPPPIAGTSPVPDSNAAVLARTLGIEAGWLGATDHGGEREQADAAAMNTALWPATLGQFLESVDKGSAAISPLVIDAVREFHRDHVRGRGPIPGIRIGSQPYGILPAWTMASQWVDDQADWFGSQLTGFLRRLRPNWMAATDELAHVGSGADLRTTMDRVLGQAAISYGVRARRCLPGSTMDQFALVSDKAKGAVDIERLLTRMLEEAIGQFSYAKLGQTLDDKARAVLLPYADDLRDPAFLAALLASGAGGNISSVFQALVSIAHSRLGTRRRPGRDFLDYVSTAPNLEPALRSDVGAFLAQPDNADLATTTRLLAALPGGRDPAMRPAARSFAMNDMQEPSFTAHFDNVSTADSRDFLGVLVADEVLRGQRLAAEFREALDHLSRDVGDPKNQARHVLVAEGLDLLSHRLDAWFTGAVSRRLTSQRAAKPNGLSIGAFAYVEQLSPERRQASPGGYILAPSLAHATTAGILRAAHLSHRTTAGERNPYAIGLSSARVRDALHLIDGIRQGQPLGALLGYRIERALQDQELGYLVLNLRSLAPLTQGRLSDRGEDVDPQAQEAIAAANVTDGLRLVEIWQGGTGAQTIKDKLARRPDNNPYLPADADWPPMTDAIFSKIEDAIRGLESSVDTVADLLLAESVHQLAQGNLPRASATMDAAGRGDVAPPEPDVVSSLRGGQPVSHSLIIIGRDGGWNPAAPRARVAPGLEGWAAERLGDPARIVIGFAENGEPIRLATGSIAALDLVALSDDSDSVVRRCIGIAPFDPAAPADPRLPAGTVALTDMLVLAESMGRLLKGARVAGGGDFGLPGAPSPYAPDPAALADLATRLDEAVSLLARQRDALVSLLAVPAVGVANLSAALVALTDFGIATPSVSREQLGETALLAAAEAKRRLAAHASVIASPSDPEELLTRRAQALFGPDFALPIPQVANGKPTLEVTLDPVRPASIRRYLSDIATVRPQVQAFSDHLLLCDSLAGKPRLAVMQMGGAPGRWAAEALPDDMHTPDAPVISIIADAPEAPPATLSGLVIDNWNETFPRRVVKGTGGDAKVTLETTAALAIHANAPNVQPAQTMLSASRPMERVGATTACSTW